jgi:DNA repair exonuclease SbcCD nuclease subunit
MRVYQTSDHHIRDSEPFFRAGAALDSWLISRLSKESEYFIYLDGGDRYHVNKETGRVNGEVVRFFTELCNLPKCHGAAVMQGNHDVKADSGSALDVLRNLNSKITVVSEPALGEGALRGFYLLPHMRPYAVEGYSGVKSYGDEEWHRSFWKSRGKDWDSVKETIKILSVHAGDETSGDLFKDADLSFLACPRSNGHIHKYVSKNHIPSASVTRRDERDKKCVMRVIDTETYAITEEDIPLFLNYASIPYGSSVEDYFKSEARIFPKESLILDIYGHDDEDTVIKEYSEKYAKNRNPRIYIGQVTPVERKGESSKAEAAGGREINTIDIKELFKEFCEEKKIADGIRDDLMARLQ